MHAQRRDAREQTVYDLYLLLGSLLFYTANMRPPRSGPSKRMWRLGQHGLMDIGRLEYRMLVGQARPLSIPQREAHASCGGKRARRRGTGSQ